MHKGGSFAAKARLRISARGSPLRLRSGSRRVSASTFIRATSQLTPGPILVPAFLPHLTLISRRGDTQKYKSGAIQPQNFFVGKAANMRADLRPRNSRDLIDHQPAKRPQSVAFAGLDRETKQRSIGWVGGERADGDRICHVETVVLKNHDWTRLSSVALAACDSPNFATLHFVQSDVLPQSATASIKAWSAAA